MRRAMAPSQGAVVRSFIKTFILPALFVLVVPLLSYVFTSYQLTKWTAEFRDSLSTYLIEQNAGAALGAEQLERLAALDIGQVSIKTCGTFGFFHEPEGGAGSMCSGVLQFVWAKYISLGLLSFALIATILAAISLLWALSKPAKQHRAFELGWWSLRLFGVPHVIGQSALMLFLSFWVTAIFMSVYSIKLIIIAALLAAFACFVAISALFKRDKSMSAEHGLLLNPDDAPTLFEHMRELAGRIGTEPPTHVVVGVQDNFFVTEVPFAIFKAFPSDDQPAPELEHIEGRTLYVSLPLMRTLSRDELSAVLAHELGHFAAGDTSLSRELNTRYKRFDVYLANMSMTFGVASCLHAFRALFSLISQKHSRVAEFAADKAAADTISANDIANALLKIAAYSTYRAETEVQLFEAMRQADELNIALRVDEGFAPFLQSTQRRASLLEDQIPHPFDSHPPLSDRFEKLNIEPPDDQRCMSLAQPPEGTWYETIATAAAAEGVLWGAYEQKFRADHDFAIALRLRPESDEEIAHVERYFPVLEFANKKGVVSIDWRGLTLEDERQILFDVLVSAERKDAFADTQLILNTMDAGTAKISLSSFADKGVAFLDAFNRYWQRDQIAQQSEQAQRSE